MNSIFAVFYRDYRQRMTNWGFVFWDLFVPLAYLTLFGLGFERMLGGAIETQGASLSYTAFLLPGIIAMVTFSVAMNTSWGFFMDKDSGIFYELLTYPLTRQQFLIGKIAFNTAVSLLASLLTVALAVAAMGVRIRWDLLPVVGATVLVATSAWFFLFSILAIRLRRMDAFNTLTSAAYILLMFFSSMFYPLDGLPTWFTIPAHLNPMTWQVDLLRFALFGIGQPSRLLWEGGALIVVGVLSLSFAVRALNRAE
jgi:ABC-2 type transport system permease protein